MLTVWPFVTGVDRTSDARFALPANLPADAYPMLDEIVKPQVWRKTRQAHALQEQLVTADRCVLFVELEEKLGLFGKNHFTGRGQRRFES